MRLFALASLALVAACSESVTAPPPDAAVDAAVAIADLAVDAAPLPDFSVISPRCTAPGSVQFTGGAPVVVPGGKPEWNLGFLQLPVGFCAHYFATVGNARQLRFAPGGELFVASPTANTSGGGQGGKNGIIVLPDDDKDGVADTLLTFKDQLPKTQGLLFTGGFFYYQDDTHIVRIPYKSGDRAQVGAAEQVADIRVYLSQVHWPKTLDVADDGSIYVGNGGDEGEMCDPLRPFHGGILKLDGTMGGAQIAKGLRNPINLRCARGHNRCFALELSMDYSGWMGGREKLIPIRAGDDWGYPCCATKDLPYTMVQPVPDCSKIAAEGDSFVIGDTPFGLAFETGAWPGKWGNRAYVALHGSFSYYFGTRIVSIEMDPVTGDPLFGTNLPGKPTGSMVDFATGWDDGTQQHGRPSAVEFSPDGRLFVANDANGVIFWIAPL